MARIAINGLGRIGSATLKLAMEEPRLEPVVVNDLADLWQLAYLLRYDSVYGRYEKEVLPREEGLVVDGREIRVYHREDPASLPWEELGIDLVFECTGAFADAEGLEPRVWKGTCRPGPARPFCPHPANPTECPSWYRGSTGPRAPVPSPRPAAPPTASPPYSRSWPGGSGSGRRS